jgi:hypothetical protein
MILGQISDFGHCLTNFRQRFCDQSVKESHSEYQSFFGGIFSAKIVSILGFL